MARANYFISFDRRSKDSNSRGRGYTAKHNQVSSRRPTTAIPIPVFRTSQSNYPTHLSFLSFPFNTTLSHSIPLPPLQKCHQSTRNQQHRRQKHKHHHRLTLPAVPQNYRNHLVDVALILGPDPAKRFLAKLLAPAVEQIVIYELLVIAAFRRPDFACYAFELEGEELRYS
jgi:hypothetical protein